MNAIRKLAVIVIFALSTTVVTPGVASADGQPAGTMAKADFARLVLAHLQAPATDGNIAVFVAWINAEGTTARWNPLATTLKTSASVGRHNRVGVQHYRDATGGAQATAATLIRAFRSITAAIRADNRGALWAAPGWSKYSGGNVGYAQRIRSIYNSVVGNQAKLMAPLPAWRQDPPLPATVAAPAPAASAPAPVPASVPVSVPVPAAPAPVPAPLPAPAVPAPVPVSVPTPAPVVAKKAVRHTGLSSPVTLRADKAATAGLGVAIAILAAAGVLVVRRQRGAAALMVAGSAGIALISATVALEDAAASFLAVGDAALSTISGSTSSLLRAGIGALVAGVLVAAGAARAGAGDGALKAARGIVVLAADMAIATFRLRTHVYAPAAWVALVTGGYYLDPRTVGWCLVCIPAVRVGMAVQARMHATATPAA